ncbi:MAG: tetratricopeptide repeat protein, partial [bacterium]|nr:tetratricopeptide repeat protein [bacterium]
MAKRPVVPALVLVGLSLSGIACREVPEARQMGELPRGERGAEAILDRGEHHEYSLRLQPDEAVHAVVEQRGIDALVEVIDPAGDVVLTVDGPIDDYGFEHVCFVAKDRGPHRLRVRAWVEDAAGPYSIRLVAQRPATPQDRACTEATRAFAAAEQQRQETGRASEELLAAYQRALELWRRAEEPYPLAVTLKQTGRVFSGLGDLQAEIRCYEEALPLLHLAGDPRQEGAVLNLRGLVYRRLGDPDLARSSFEEALGIAQQTGDRRGEGTALSNLALWEVASGEIHRAIELYQQCLEIWGTLGRRYQEATTLHNLGSAYSRLGRFAEALDALEEAREVRQEIGGRDRLATTWLAIGWVEHLSGDGEAAAERFRTAIELYREAGSRLGEAAAHDRLGSAYRRLGRSGDAFDAYRTGLEIYREAGDRANTAHAASNLGCLLGELRRWEEAREALGEARELFETLGERAGLAHVRFCEARVERGDGDPEAALRSIEEALALVDALRSSALRQGHRFPALGLWQDYSELYVELLMMLHEREPGAGYDARAFEVSDLARARRLYQMLLESRVDVRSGVPEELLERERAVQRRLNAVELRRQSLLARGAVKEEVAEVDRTLRGLLLELEDVWVAIRSASPRFAELRQPSPVRLAELRQLLEPGTLLLSYVLAEERSFLFLVSRDRLSSYVLPGRRRLERLARRFYHGLRASDQRRTRLQKRTNATVLSETLVGPIGDELGSHRLLVVGDGMLHYVPFAALPLPAAGESKELLIDRYEVVHLPSAAVMKALRQRAAERAAP